MCFCILKAIYLPVVIGAGGRRWWGKERIKETPHKISSVKRRDEITACHWPCWLTTFSHPFYKEYCLLDRSFLEQCPSLLTEPCYSTEIAIPGCCLKISRDALDLAPQNNFSVWIAGLTKAILGDGGGNNYSKLPNMLINSRENAVRLGWFLKIIFMLTGLIQLCKEGNI